jgi:hypothetical protein
MLLAFIDPTAPAGSLALRPITRPGDTPPTLAFVQQLLGGAVEAILTVHIGESHSFLLYVCAERGTQPAICRVDLGLFSHCGAAATGQLDGTIYGPVLIVGGDLEGGHRSLSEEEFAAFTLVADVRPNELPVLHFRALDDDAD